MNKKLQTAKYSQTLQRNVLSRLFLDKPRHCTADMLYAEVKAEGYKFSRATIYNTLRTFVDNGLAKEIIVHEGKKFFDSRVDDHHHFYNQENGDIFDIPLSAIPTQAINEILANNNFSPKIKIDSLIVRGKLETN